MGKKDGKGKKKAAPAMGAAEREWREMGVAAADPEPPEPVSSAPASTSSAAAAPASTSAAQAAPASPSAAQAAPAPTPVKGPRAGGLRGVFDGLVGARLCYGEPVVNGVRTVVPVSRVRLSGGGGWGENGAEGEGSGGGGGGHLDAQPLGFIEIGDEGAQYHAIPDPDHLAKTLKTAATAITMVATGIAAARRVRGGRRRRLGRGRR